MVSWTRLVSLRGWLALRRVFFTAPALILLALSGGLTPRSAKAQAPSGSLLVYFSGATKPPVCKGQAYKVFAEPFVRVGQVESMRLFDAAVDVLPATIGTIFPSHSLVTVGGPAVFIYKSDKTG